MKPAGAGKRRLQKAVLGVLAAALAALAAVYILDRSRFESGSDLLDKAVQGTSLRIENLRHTAAREGRTEWELTAASAQMAPGKKSATLDRVSAVFYMEDGGRVHLTADTGRLETASNDLSVAGNVIVRRQAFRLTTERLRYFHAERRLEADKKVAVSGEAVFLEADTAEFDLNTKRLRFLGDVHGTIDQALDL